MADVSHASLTADADLHEPKGTAAATAGQIYVADGAGSGSFSSIKHIQQGIYDYNDLTTASTQIPLTLAGTQYEMTNDGTGAFTNKTYKFTDIDDLWNTSTNRFDFTGLSLGDTVDIRFDLEATTAAVNTSMSLALELGIGGSPYQLALVDQQDKKSAGTYQLTRFYSIYMGDTNTLNNPARVLASADKTGVTVKVNGWYIRGLRSV